MHVIITTTAIDALVIFIPFLVGKNIKLMSQNWFTFKFRWNGYV